MGTTGCFSAGRIGGKRRFLLSVYPLKRRKDARTFRNRRPGGMPCSSASRNSSSSRWASLSPLPAILPVPQIAAFGLSGHWLRRNRAQFRAAGDDLKPLHPAGVFRRSFGQRLNINRRINQKHGWIIFGRTAFL